MSGLEAIKNILVFLLLLLAAGTDIREMRIPNRFIGSALVLRALLFVVEWRMKGEEVFIQGMAGLTESMVLVLGLTLFTALSRHGFGFGDVKLLGAVSLCLSVERALTCLLYGLLLAGGASILLLSAGKINCKDKLPLAPFLLMGYILAFFRKSC